ncbi:MAG: 16S rRNA (guanine(966)-N(2))-methyltransferase RsmD [Pseudomonadota bacterium]
MRIIAGRYKGTRLAALGKGDAGAHLRPTTDRVRESLFNVLHTYLDWDGLRVLDLFAGTGALGLEAYSRGAAHITFVENGRVGQKILSQNIDVVQGGADMTVLKCDATRLPHGTPCDVVFLDPPYGKNLGGAALQSAQAKGWIAPDALIIWEENATMSAPGQRVLNSRRYGDTWITLLQPDQMV